MKIILRSASSKDAAVLADFARQTFETAFGPDNNPDDMQAYLDKCFTKDQLKSELAKPDVIYLLAYDEKMLVGYVKLEVGPPPDYDSAINPVQLSRLYVDSHLLGKGIGTQLMALTLQECHQRGYESVWLGVWDQNMQARKFYERCGYQKIGTKSFILGNDTQIDTVYLLDLRSDIN